MKSILFLASAIVLVAQPVLASGTTDIYCRSVPNPKDPSQAVRYTYDEGDQGISVTVYRSKGVDEKKFKAIMKDENPISLEASELDTVTKERDVLGATGCMLGEDTAPAAVAQDQKDYEKCMEGKRKADVNEKDTTGSRPDPVHSGKEINFDHIVQTVTYHDAKKSDDDSVVTLDIENFNNAIDGDYHGTLTIKTKKRAYREMNPLKVVCRYFSP